MTVERYLFQSPYSSQVQIGRPDPSVSKQSNNDAELLQNTNQTAQKAQQFQASQTQDVKPSVLQSENQLLDVYA